MAFHANSKNTQLQATIDVIFQEISTKSPHIVTHKNVKTLVDALEKNQCFDADHPKRGNRLDIFEDIKKKMTMNKESRATLITWLVNFAANYYTQFETREKIEGIQILMRPKIDEIEEPDKLKATEWLKGMCLKPLFDKGIPGLTSLAKSILISCKYENVEIDSVQEDDLEKRLTTGMDIKLMSTTFDKCLPENLYRNEREFEKMNKLYLGLPLCVLHASENLKVNIRIICFPSREEVIFYNQKRNFTIHIGLIGQETYVPLIKITEDDPDTMSGLIATIKMLRATIKELKETKTKTEEEKQDLLKKIERIEKQLEKKQEEYRLMKLQLSEKARHKIKKNCRSRGKENGRIIR